MELTDEQIETLIENSDGHWREDTFRIDGPSLTALLRAAAKAASADVQGEGYDQAALDAASLEVQMLLLREGSRWGTKACEEMGRVFMTAYFKALRDNSKSEG